MDINPEFVAQYKEFENRKGVSETIDKKQLSEEQIRMLDLEIKVYRDGMVEVENSARDYHKVDNKAIFDWNNFKIK